MSQEPIKLSTETTKKINELLRNARKELGMILVKSWLMAVGAIIPITIVSAVSGLILTGFPFFAGLMTAVLIQVRYVGPKAKEVGERYGKEIKDLLEKERRAKTPES